MTVFLLGFKLLRVRIQWVIVQVTKIKTQVRLYSMAGIECYITTSLNYAIYICR